MRLHNWITGATIAGLLAVAANAQIVSQQVPGLQSKVLTITRDLTVATGSVGYTSVGFRPTTCTATGRVAASITQNVNIFGVSDSALGQTSTYIAANVVDTTSGRIITSFDASGTSGQTFAITSYDADGFTGTWTKTGAPTGTFTGYVTCYR